MDLLIKQIKLRSVYTSGHVKNNEGSTQEGYLGITDAEKDLVNLNLRDAANLLYQKFQPLVRQSENAFLYNYTPANSSKHTIVYELWLHENWDKKMTSPLSVACEKFLVNYCLKDWFLTINQRESFAAVSANFDAADSAITNAVINRKIPVTKPYNFF